MPPTMAAWSLNHCTTREVLRIFLDYDVYAKASLLEKVNNMQKQII